MNTETLLAQLAHVGVGAETVSIGKEADDAWCVVPAPVVDGDTVRVEWEVYRREQGNRYDWARFTDERVACFYLFGRVTWGQVVQGVLRTAEPPVATERDDDSPPPAVG